MAIVAAVRGVGTRPAGAPTRQAQRRSVSLVQNVSTRAIANGTKYLQTNSGCFPEPALPFRQHSLIDRRSVSFAKRSTCNGSTHP